MKTPRFDILSLIFLVNLAILSGCMQNISPSTEIEKNTTLVEQEFIPKEVEESTLIETGSKRLSPIDRSIERITKKPFGIAISPMNSPISPEKFTGYHTGIDFEIFDGEEDTPIEIRALCDGTLIQKKWISGYGGVAIQKCTLGGIDATILYGHLDIDSITRDTNTEIKLGEEIGILGKGYSTETDMERKHLHLSIYRGESINLRGYVSTEAELRDWIDPRNYLQ